MGEAASTVTEEVVYVGRKAAGNGKLAHWYRALVDGELTDKEIGSSKPYTAAPVGAIATHPRPAGQPTMLYTKRTFAPRHPGPSDHTAYHQQLPVTQHGKRHPAAQQ